MRRIAAAAVVVVAMATPAAAQYGGLQCSVFDDSRRPVTTLEPRQPFIFEGLPFDSGSSVLLLFVQEGEEAQLTRVTAGGAGAVTTNPDETRIPSGARFGPATVRAEGTSDDAPAACNVSITVAEDAETGSGGSTSRRTIALAALWGLGFAVFGFILVVARRRRRQEDEIVDVVDEPGERLHAGDRMGAFVGRLQTVIDERFRRRGAEEPDVEGPVAEDDDHTDFIPPPSDEPTTVFEEPPYYEDPPARS